MRYSCVGEPRGHSAVSSHSNDKKTPKKQGGEKMDVNGGRRVSAGNSSGGFEEIPSLALKSSP